MTYPRKMMTTTELIKECGFTRKFLMQMAHMEGQKYARKLPGGKRFYWDTEKLGRAIERLPSR